MPGLFRIELPDGATRLAVGPPETGPTSLLDAGLDIDALLGTSGSSPWRLVADATTTTPVPAGSRVCSPIGSQPVWAAGVTYERSRQGREAESLAAADVYGLVYEAERPELFLKASGPDVVGPGEAIGVRRDSTWDVPEPELTLVLDAGLGIVGLTIGNDVSSRSIEGANPLYLPQAKVYERSCAIGPCITPLDEAPLPAAIAIAIERGGGPVFQGQTSTAAMHRRLEDLVDWLGKALPFPTGCFLMTGTGIVPPDDLTLRTGDTVEIQVSGLGVLRNPVVEVGRA